MKKKLMASVLCLSLLLIMLLGSTLAWFTDDVGTTNTMVVGNVKIAQREYFRNNGALEELPDNNGTTEMGRLYPYTGDGVKSNATLWTTDDYKMFDTAKNAVDKIVTIENTGSEDAYIRTVFAFEMMKIDGQWANPLTVGKDNPAEVVLNVHETFNGTVPVQFIDFTDTEILIYKYENGTYGANSANAVAAYVVGVYTYKEALAAPTTTNPSISAPSLLQFYLADHVGNEFSAAVGGQYDIIVLSQGVQTQGFESAAEAMEKAFGDFTAAHAAKWFNDIQ